MATFTHTASIRYTGGSGSPLSYNVTATADGETNRRPAVAHSTTNVLLEISIDVSAVSLLLICSNKDVTLSTNDQHSGSPAAELLLKADVPVLWSSDSGLPNPLGSTDVTSMHFLNAGSTSADDAIVEIRILQDATP